EIDVDAVGLDVDFLRVEVGRKFQDRLFVVLADGDGEGALAEELGEEFGEGIGENVVGGQCAAEGDVEQARGVVAEEKLAHGEVDVEEIELEIVDLMKGGVPGEAVLPELFG